MKTLTGTEKQIESAAKIRDEKRADMEARFVEIGAEATDDAKATRRAKFEQIADMWDATDWLDNSRMSGMAIAELTVRNGKVRLF